MNCTSFNKFFEVIAGKTRLKIIESLNSSPKCVSEISEELKEEQSMVSHNLRILHECHFVELSKQGRKHVYKLNQKTIVPILQIVKQHVTTNCKGCTK